jgi:hypothetical protein
MTPVENNLPSFEPPLPARQMGELKDMAQDVITASATLDGRIADQTARALGDRLRYLNSYHSNLIEGHKTSILVEEGLVHSTSHRAPLTIGFPTQVLKYYFPDLFDPSVLGEEQV